MRTCVHVSGGRSSWPGRTVQHEFGFDAGEALVDAVELLARVQGEQDDDQEAAGDGVDEGFQIEEESDAPLGVVLGAVLSADEIHQGIGLTLGESDVEKPALRGQGQGHAVRLFKGQCAAWGDPEAAGSVPSGRIGWCA